jgi:urease accessory protein
VPQGDAPPLTDDWLLWQLVDSAFPSGGFAHSGGLEAAYQNGVVTHGERLYEFLDAQLRSATYSAAPFVLAAFRDSNLWSEVDLACDVFLSNHVANRASRAQGGALLTAAERVFGIPRMGEIRSEVRSGQLPAHLAPILGAMLAALGIAEARIGQILLFLTVRGGISSAVRLGIVGPMEAQSIQHAIGPAVDRWARLALTLGIDDAAQTSPVLDLLQATQDRLYSRLFQS